MAKAVRETAGASSSRSSRHDYPDTGADTDVSDDDLEEIVSESDSDADSADYKLGSEEDEEDTDGGDDGSGDERSTRPSKKEHRAPASRNKRVWSDAELTSLAAARWNTKDDLKAMQGKQGSQYWRKLRAHMLEKDKNWDRDEGQMSNAWKRLEKKYLKTKRGEGQSGGKAIKKKPWWEYVYHLKKHSAKAKAHALDGGGAANVDVQAYAPVPGCTDRETSAPPSEGRGRAKRRSALCLPLISPSLTLWFNVRRIDRQISKRIEETATMAAAKMVSEAINSTNATVVRQLQDSTQLLVAAMNMAALQAGFRMQIASPPAPIAAPSNTPTPAHPEVAGDENMGVSEDVEEHAEP
ncbi:unnamed protein product [Closterium sp. NIES-65]|nr:unnamed protein product [Closterium sp. NIES-65]